MRVQSFSRLVADKLGMQAKDVTPILVSFFDTLNELLSKGCVVSFPGIGKFTPSLRGGYTKPNYFKKGEDMYVAPYVNVRFTQFESSKRKLYEMNKTLWDIVLKSKNTTTKGGKTNEK